MPQLNAKTEAQFLSEFNHPRKKELAQMILDGKSVEEMNAAGFGRINILEMARTISREVEGKADFSLDIPRGEGESDLAGAEEVAAAAQKKTDSEKSSVAPVAGEADSANSDANVRDGGAHDTETLGGNEQTVRTGEEDAEKLAEIKKDEDAEQKGDEGHETVETLGGNQVGTTTGQEDAETLKRREGENNGQA